MKKFIVIVILLIAAVGTAFFFGWVSFFLGNDSYAVSFTKTSGWSHELIRPGSFEWRWERLIPTNMTLYRFKVRQYQSVVSSTGILPSGNIYAAYMDGNPDFTYELSFFVAFTVRPEALPDLARENDLRPDTLDAWNERMAESIKQETVTFMQDNGKSNAGPALVSGVIEENLQNYLSEVIPQIEISTVSLKTIKIPDIDLYKRGRDMYFTILKAKETALSKATSEIAQEKATEDRKIEKLRELGEILTQYPVLLKYFALGSDVNIDSIDLDQLPLSGQKAQNGAQ